ncbi:MAG: amidohydrolase [Phycisphaerales bacterium]|nr:amidohydrolase [Phycisphaerales bacterium]
MTTTAKGLDLRAMIRDELDSIVELRRDLHRHPELGYQERYTSELVARELEAAGVAFKTGMAETGVLGHLSGRADKAVALRADMDALPIVEETGLPYASQNAGRMHACGHDGHTAILVGAARVLSKIQDRPNPVTFVFQPAEEGGGGGGRMTDEGCLDGEAGGGLGVPVSRIYGLHGWPNLALGRVASKPGPLLASTDEFVITVRGVGGHAAMPHFAKDPVVASAHIVTALQTIASRSVAPVDAVVCTVGQINGGVANNVIPETVTMVGTVRTLRAETRELAQQRLFQLAQRTAEAYGCKAEVEWHPGYPVTRNDDGATEKFFGIARAALGDDAVSLVPEPAMGGEDFSYYGMKVPACFFLLGLTPGAQGDGTTPAPVPQLHQPLFNFNDEAIATGIEMMCRLALEG